MKKKILLALIIMSIITVFSAFSSEETVLDVPKIEIPPNIDGKLDDDVWENALKMTGFKTFEPDYDKEPHEKTEAYMVYDEENFYFGIRCYDSESNKIKATVCKRDGMFGDDWAALVIDTFNAKQDGYAFFINPFGIQGDGILDTSGSLGDTHDMVWYSKGEIDDLGYTVECQIPLKSIRFSSKKIVIMRLAFFRQLVRHSEMSAVPAFNPEKGGILTQSQAIRVEGLKYKRVVEILPALVHNQIKDIDDGQLVMSDKLTEASLTTKVGLTSELIMDATLNPDFSQIEADAGQVDINLRYDLFFPEKRPFFLEGRENFQFAGNTEEAPLRTIFHTRNIINPEYGFKLAGKLGGKNTIAVLYARDNLSNEDETFRPHFSIFRYRRAMKDDSYLGVFYTGRDIEGSWNRLFGLDGRIRLTQKSLAEYHVFGTFSHDSDSQENIQGHAFALRYNYGTRKVVIDTGIQDVSEDFQIDTGYITRTGITRFTFFSMYIIYPKSKFFQRIEPFYWSYHIYDRIFDMFETLNLFTLRFQLPGSTQFRIDGLYANEVFEGARFDRSGAGIQLYSQVIKEIFLYAFYRGTGSVFYDPDDPYQGYSNRLSVGVEFQPFDKLNSSMSLSYVDFFRRSDREKIYDYALIRNRTTFQMNKYLFFRSIVEYNSFREKLTTDFLASFTYIPGTVIHIGYGSVYYKLEWDNQDYVASDHFLETKRGFFFKISYLLRL